MTRTRGRWLLLLLVVGAVASLLRPPPVARAADGPRANGMVVLLTDYGSADPYVGILKGVIISAWPQARIFDATHDAPNFDAASASYMLGRIAPEWPAGTTFVVVVDPGVGTRRRGIAIETLPDGKRYIGPDNGVFSDVLAQQPRFRCYEVSNEKLRRPGVVSATFHGRDWFGPVGGHVAGGTPLSAVGAPVADPVRLSRVAVHREADAVVGAVLYVDHYGNLLTNIGHPDLVTAGFKEGSPLEIRVGQGNWTKVPWVGTYGDVPRGALLLTTHNAQGGVEVAVNYGDAKERLAASGGMVLAVRPAHP